MGLQWHSPHARPGGACVGDALQGGPGLWRCGVHIHHVCRQGMHSIKQGRIRALLCPVLLLPVLLLPVLDLPVLLLLPVLFLPVLLFNHNLSSKGLTS